MSGRKKQSSTQLTLFAAFAGAKRVREPDSDSNSPAESEEVDVEAGAAVPEPTASATEPEVLRSLPHRSAHHRCRIDLQRYLSSNYWCTGIVCAAECQLHLATRPAG